MPFTVNRDDGLTKDAEFEDYVRLLRQKGVDLGKLPRVVEPKTGKRWLYVWQVEAQARAFATELSKRTGNSWVVVKVDAPPSEGPMGPIIIQVSRRSDGLVFGLHSLSRTIIQSAFPESKSRGAKVTVSINFDTYAQFLESYGSINNLANEIVPTLTGLDKSQLERIGYALIEEDSDRTLVFVPPNEIAHA